MREPLHHPISLPARSTAQTNVASGESFPMPHLSNRLDPFCVIWPVFSAASYDTITKTRFALFCSTRSYGIAASS